MATTASDSLALSTKLPEWKLLDVLTGAQVGVTERPFSKGILVIILCAHCPYVKHLEEGIKKMAAHFLPQGIAFVGVSANDPMQYPEDAPQELAKMVVEGELPFSILFDETQEFVRALGAVCTPDFFLFNEKLQLVYHGRFDASTPRNGIPSTGEDLERALKTLCQGQILKEPWASSIGCSIKWR